MNKNLSNRKLYVDNNNTLDESHKEPWTETVNESKIRIQCNDQILLYSRDPIGSDPI